MLVSLNHSINHFPWILSLSNISGFITHRSITVHPNGRVQFRQYHYRVPVEATKHQVSCGFTISNSICWSWPRFFLHLSFLRRWRQKQACVCVLQCVPNCYANCLSSCVMCNIYLSFYVSICLSICPSVYVSVHIHLGILPPTVAIPYRNCKATGGHPLGGGHTGIISIYLCLFIHSSLLESKIKKPSMKPLSLGFIRAPRRTKFSKMNRSSGEEWLA